MTGISSLRLPHTHGACIPASTLSPFTFASLFLTGWLGLFHVCLRTTLNTHANAYTNIWFSKPLTTFNHKVKAVFSHLVRRWWSSTGTFPGPCTLTCPWTLADPDCDWVHAGEVVLPTLCPCRGCQWNLPDTEDSSQPETTSVQGHCGCVNATAPLPPSWMESSCNYCDRCNMVEVKRLAAFCFFLISHAWNSTMGFLQSLIKI